MFFHLTFQFSFVQSPRPLDRTESLENVTFPHFINLLPISYDIGSTRKILGSVPWVAKNLSHAFLETTSNQLSLQNLN